MTSRHLRALACGLGLAGAALAAAARAAPAPAPPAAERFRLGRFELTALRDALNVLPNDGKVFGVEAGPQAVAGVLKRAGAPADSITLSVDGLLVQEPGRVVLIDTGLGPPARGVLLESLAKAGVAPGQVTDVLVTHAHGDHVGGLVTADGAPAFPKAVVRMSAAEWTWMQGQARSQGVAKVIAGQVRTFQPGETVAPGIVAVSIPGHTPGHVGYEISSGGQKLLDMGDTAHSSVVSLAAPDMAIAYDTDPVQGRESRRALLTRLAKSGEYVWAPHFPFPGVGRVRAAGEGFVWVAGAP